MQDEQLPTNEFENDRASKECCLTEAILELDWILREFIGLPQDALRACKKLSRSDFFLDPSSIRLISDLASFRLTNVIQNYSIILKEQLHKYRRRLVEEARSVIIDVFPYSENSQVCEILNDYLEKKSSLRKVGSDIKKLGKKIHDDQLESFLLSLDTTKDTVSSKDISRDEQKPQIKPKRILEPSAPGSPPVGFPRRGSAVSTGDFVSSMSQADWSTSVLQTVADATLAEESADADSGSTNSSHRAVVVFSDLRADVSPQTVARVVAEVLPDVCTAERDVVGNVRLLFEHNLSVHMAEFLEVLSRNQKLLQMVKIPERERSQKWLTEKFIVGMEVSTPASGAKSTNKLYLHELEAREQPLEDIPKSKLNQIVSGLKVVQMDKQGFLPKSPEHPVSHLITASSCIFATKLHVATNKDYSLFDLKTNSFKTYHEELSSGQEPPNKSIRAVADFGFEYKVFGRVDHPICIYQVEEKPKTPTDSAENYPRLKRKAVSNHNFMGRVFKNSWNRTATGLAVKDNIIYFLGYNPNQEYPQLKDRKLPIISASLVEFKWVKLDTNHSEEKEIYPGVEDFIVEHDEEIPKHTAVKDLPITEEMSEIKSPMEATLAKSPSTKLTLLTNSGEVVRLSPNSKEPEKKYSLKNIDGLNLWSSIVKCGTRYVVAGWIQTQSYNGFYLLDKHLSYKNSLKVHAGDRTENMPVGQLLARSIRTRDQSALKVPLVIAGLTSGHLFVLALGADSLMLALRVPNTSQSKENSAITLCGMGGYIYAGGNTYIERFLLRL